jgi:hypothetical protein
MRNNTFHSGAKVTGKLKAYYYLKTLMLAFVLLTSIIITSPEYVQCSSILPDEALDLPGISSDATLLRHAPDQSALFIFDFPPISPVHHWYSSESLSLPPAISEMFSSAILRC